MKSPRASVEEAPAGLLDFTSRRIWWIPSCGVRGCDGPTAATRGAAHEGWTAASPAGSHGAALPAAASHAAARAEAHGVAFDVGPTAGHARGSGADAPAASGAAALPRGSGATPPRRLSRTGSSPTFVLRYCVHADRECGGNPLRRSTKVGGKDGTSTWPWPFQV